jgi:hypothetical protein
MNKAHACSKTNFDQKNWATKILIILYIISIVGFVLKNTF